MDPGKIAQFARIYRVFDPFRILRPKLPLTHLPNNLPFFKPTQGPGTGPGSGGGSIAALRLPILGPVPGQNEVFPIPPRPNPI